MGDDKNTLNDIKSGKGLPPINTNSNENSSKGLTTENRGQDSKGVRTDRFTLNQNSDKKGDK